MFWTEVGKGKHGKTANKRLFVAAAAAAVARVWSFNVSSHPQCVTLHSFSYLNPHWITPI